jgi:hypothetical protein
MPLTDRLGIACVSAMALALSVLTESQSPTTSQQASPDAIYYNGHIVTMWADHPEGHHSAIRRPVERALLPDLPGHLAGPVLDPFRQQD